VQRFDDRALDTVDSILARLRTMRGILDQLSTRAVVEAATRPIKAAKARR